MTIRKTSILNNIQTKLILISVVVGVITIAVIFFAFQRLIEEYISERFKNEVSANTTIVLMEYKARLEEHKNITKAISEAQIVKELTGLGIKREKLHNCIAGFLRQGFVDMVIVTDDKGVVAAKAVNPRLFGYNISHDELVKEALKGRLAAGTVLISEKELRKEKLSERVHNQKSALMIKAAAPVYSEFGTLLGTAIAGRLINNNPVITVGLKGIIKNFAIYQGDSVVLTNMTDTQGNTILGEKLDPEVKKQILEAKTFLTKIVITGGKKFLAGYLPIKNVRGKVIGLFSSSTSFDSITEMKKHITNIILLIIMGALSIAIILTVFVSRSITKPIAELRDGIEIIGAGNLDHKVSISAKDEIGQLSRAFDRMTGNLKIITASRDELKKAQEALRESEARYRSVFENTGTATMIIEEDTTISLANTEFEKLSGYSSEETEGKISWTQLVVKEDLEKMKAYHALRREKGEKAPTEYEFCFVDKRQNKKDVFLKVDVIPGTKKSVASVMDITSRKRAEEALLESEEELKKYSEGLEDMVYQRTKELKDAQEQLVRREKLVMLGQLSGSVGHELRNPMGVISNAVYYLQMTLPDADETTRKYLDIISSEVRNSEKIVSDLLNFSRTRVGTAEREETAVSSLVERVLEKQPPPENIEVTTEIPSDLPFVYVDARQMDQVLVNLVTNACQAMPEGGRLTLRAADVQDKVHLIIADTGCGISRENVVKIFEPLFTTRVRGIGLGLAVSMNLVEVNGGNIDVESEEGKGTTFTVILPTKEAGA